MSFDALAWAGKMKPGSSSCKLVLLALADRHNTEEHISRPSIAWIAEWADLDRKTVIASLQRLEALGLITDSSQRFGNTRQIKGYTLSLEKTVPKTKESQKRNSSDFPIKESQKRDTDTIKEPIGSEAKASSPSAWARPADIEAQVWKDFLGNRKRKRLGNSLTAWKRFQDDLERVSASSGIPPNQLIEHAAAKGWGGIYDPTEQNGPTHDKRTHGTDSLTAIALQRIGALQH